MDKEKVLHGWDDEKVWDVNVQVGTHIPPPYFEVPVHIRLYCEDLSARLASVKEQEEIEKISETLAYADWRFQG